MSTDEARTSSGPGTRHASRARISLSRTWTATAVLVPALVISLLPLQAIDLAYQLRAGALMLDRGALLRVDEFTLLATGRPWLNQQWGSQVLLELTFRGGGWFGLALLRSLLVATTAGFVYLACRASGATARAAAMLTLTGALFFQGGFALRPQLLGMVCFGATLWLVAGRRQHRGRFLLVVPIVAVWANLHGSFVLGPIAIGLGAVQDLAERDSLLPRTVLVGLAATAATLLNPLGPHVWSYVWDLTNNPVIARTIQEWRRPTLDPREGIRFGFSLAFFVTVVAAVVFVARSGARPRWPLMLALVAFAVPGFDSIRGIFWWGMAAPVVVAQALPRERRVHEASGPVNLANTAIVIVLCLIPAVGVLRWLPYRDGSLPPQAMMSFAPFAVTEELRSTLEPGEPFFNAQLWGSWFEFALPDHPVVSDSRIEVIPGTAWNDYLAVSRAGEGWQSTLDRWGIRVVALRRDQQAPLIAAMQDDPGWTETLETPEGAVFVRTEP